MGLNSNLCLFFFLNSAGSSIFEALLKRRKSTAFNLAIITTFYVSLIY